MPNRSRNNTGHSRKNDLTICTLISMPCGAHCAIRMVIINERVMRAPYLRVAQPSRWSSQTRTTKTWSNVSTHFTRRTCSVGKSPHKAWASKCDYHRSPRTSARTSSSLSSRINATIRPRGGTAGKAICILASKESKSASASPATGRCRSRPRPSGTSSTFSTRATGWTISSCCTASRSRGRRKSGCASRWARRRRLPIRRVRVDARASLGTSYTSKSRIIVQRSTEGRLMESLRPCEIFPHS